MLKDRRASIKFTIDVFACLGLSLIAAIAFQLGGRAMLQRFEVPDDRPMITNFDAKR